MMNGPGRGAETATIVSDRSAGSDQAYLLVIEDGSSSMYRLPNPGEVTIGRAPDVELRVDHPSVSRRHARIQVNRGEARLSDLGSHNGTRLNGVRIGEEHVLMTGDVISIGEV